MKITHGEKIAIVENMRRHGGNFAEKFADALIAADPENTERLVNAFPELIKKYTA
jgi:2-oxo-4-hydroxy-4-carboxy--5-ureidoimidazoline (OHCU) decarboxylase